jgi:hypothetical protein
MTNFTNADGLTIRYGLDVAKGAQVGVPCAYGAIKQIVAILEVARMDLTGGLIGGLANSALPVGSVILRSNLIVTETFTGTNGTLDLGLCNEDGTYTNLDEDGIDVAIAVASLAAGTVIANDGALVGAGTSKATTVVSFLSYDIDTTDFTAGKALLVVEYVEPMYPNQGVD